MSTCIVFVLVICYVMYRTGTTRKELYGVRPIAGLDAIQEAVQRATEMGRPIIVVPGSGDIADSYATQTLAGLAILKYTATLASRYDTRLITSLHRANVISVATAIIRDAFLAEGKSDMLRDDTVQWFSEEQFAFAAATMGLIDREKVGAAVLTGFFQAESLLLAEAAATAGAMTIGGTAQVVQAPWFVVCCDYVLLGEELMVASAYLEKSPTALGVVRAQDILKVALMLITVAGIAMMTVSKNDSLIKLLRK